MVDHVSTEFVKLVMQDFHRNTGSISMAQFTNETRAINAINVRNPAGEKFDHTELTFESTSVPIDRSRPGWNKEQFKISAVHKAILEKAGLSDMKVANSVYYPETHKVICTYTTHNGAAPEQMQKMLQHGVAIIDRMDKNDLAKFTLRVDALYQELTKTMSVDNLPGHHPAHTPAAPVKPKTSHGR